jgi:hypothetical protein
MASDHRPSDRRTERDTAEQGSSTELAVGIIAVLAVIAVLFFTLFDAAPPGPSVAWSDPTASDPQWRTPSKAPPPATTMPSPSAE